MFNIILAHDINLGIGKNNKIPWKIKEDLQHFKDITMSNENNKQNILIMGRKTAESIKSPLKNRYNIVVTSDINFNNNFILKKSLLDALEFSVREHNKSEIFIIGGAEIIKETLNYANLIKKIFITKIFNVFDCDVKIDNLYEKLNLAERKKEMQFTTDNIPYQFCEYTLIRNDCNEQKYLNQMYELLKATPRKTRNSITRSLFSTTLSFDLREGFPLLTTKKVFWKGVVYELLFFLAGHTDNKWLREKGVHIWDKNSSKEFIETQQLNLKEDDIGPMYGFQWRHYGAIYKGKDYNYQSEGLDQLQEVIKLLIDDPTSRRILMTTYNYNQVKEGVLYPCHGLTIQFYVEDNVIHLQMYQRSVDYFLGLCFNIASYALLLHIIVNYINTITKKLYVAGKIHLMLGDYHLYDNHIRQAIIQLSRTPKKLPDIIIKKNITSINPEYLLNLSVNNFEIVNYDCYPAIKADMIA